MKIANIDTTEQVFIIAEIGNNHEGDFGIAKEMVHAAKSSGADAVKFQTFQIEHFISKNDKDRFAKLKSFELSYDQFADLAELANKLGIIFISTPLDIQSAIFLNSIVPAFKISSGDNNFYPLLETVAAFDKPILLSTGFADLQVIAQAKSVIESVWKQQNSDPGLALLHCVSNYPALPEEMNLLALKKLAKEFGCTLGFSDHTTSFQSATMSVALGARIVEKHFTLDKNFSDFRDHKISADPAEMRNYVEEIRKAQILLGKQEKFIQDSERSVLPKVRRFVIARSELKSGHEVTYDDITWIRTEGDFPAGSEKGLIGKKIKKDIGAGESFKRFHVE